MRNADVGASKIAAWELFVAGMQPLLEKMPHLQPFHDRIQGLIVEARELYQQEEKAQKEARELTHRRQAMERDGDNLRARAAAHLRASFGFTSEHLIPFGITPRRAGRRGDPESTASSERGGQ
jgi:hypothetical protein